MRIDEFHKLMERLSEEHDADSAYIRQADGGHEIVLYWDELDDFPEELIGESLTE